ncbi:hypothetical protein BSQ39_01820 [Loigolactobacillus backii]|uniref:DUF2188 domain-containing protein n=1 Tax=Loigolactobacillus TaxID=2767889 RepID=UPI000C1CA85A|nr:MULTISPECIES: DUF2188 domain-containing protein [Loigolactobacillus]PIO82387.1 hypothetical protein BSQ39_01820 [Loigolactobacillus backii]
MPWNMQDYPNSMKNMPEQERKKAIDIGNALLADGYPDDRAIPIAISQAEKWYQDATPTDKQKLRNDKNPTKHDKHSEKKSNPELIDSNELVKHQENGWAVMAEGGKQPSEVFPTKEEALKRAHKIVANKDSVIKVYKRDGSLQDEIRPKK